MSPPRRAVRVTVNDVEYEAYVQPRRLLSDFIREDTGLTGTHVGCEHGVCGACTVLLDGQTVRSCLMFAVQADGRSIRTVESLAEEEELSPLQRSFSEHHGLQCGFCTPGMLMTATELLESTPTPSEAEIRDALSGNLCRCTGYQNIVAAISAMATRENE
jgi:aerobic-type carbon monoxide dehydrogenase small subunit (CoxS/CutS family)